MVLGVGTWAVLQALAGGYARGHAGGGPVSRYMDSLSFISISGALAAFVLLNDYRASRRFFPLVCAAMACWTLGCLGGLGVLANRAWTLALPEMSAERASQLKAARAWMATGDPRVFLAQPADERLAPLAARLMTEPLIRGVLPACVREPLRVEPAQITSNAFVRNGWRLTEAEAPTETGWGSYSAQQAAARGTFESQRVRKSALPYLEIPVAGDLGGDRLSLELVELNGGKVTVVGPSAPPGGEWVNVRVNAPEGEFKVVATDDGGTKWFAFKEPRELGRWSFWTLRVLACWKYFVVLGVAGFLVNVAGMFRTPAQSD
jgi:hypothetical protein